MSKKTYEELTELLVRARQEIKHLRETIEYLEKEIMQMRATRLQLVKENDEL